MDWLVVMGFALLFVGGFFRHLVEREIQWQRDHGIELARERREFHQPVVEQIEEPEFLIGRPVYETQAPYEARYRGHRWLIPEKRRTDLASIPRWLWSLTGYLPDGLVRAAALVHDDLCENRPDWCNWLDAADVFRHYQRLAYVKPSKIVARWLAVVVFGPKWLRKMTDGTDGTDRTKRSDRS